MHPGPNATPFPASCALLVLENTGSQEKYMSNSPEDSRFTSQQPVVRVEEISPESPTYMGGVLILFYDFT